MAKRPDAWMPLYVADWDSDTRHLDCEQDGAYGRLVRHYWRNGPPADDDVQLSRIVGMERSRWRKVRASVAPFFEIREGRWFHKRVEEELERARQIIEKRRQAGLQGGRPRKQMVSESESKTKPNGIANGNQTGKQNETPARVTVDVPTSEPSTSPSQVRANSDSDDVSSDGKVIPLVGRADR